jgi:hypothetical protein
MAVTNRIPECQDHSFDGMLGWFAELSRCDLLIHPDDDPASIVSTETGRKVFSRSEAIAVRSVISKFFKANGDDVYEAAYPIFMKRLGIQLDA